MPHADSSLVPETIQSKTDFWAHVHTELQYLLESERNWVSLTFHSEEMAEAYGVCRSPI